MILPSREDYLRLSQGRRMPIHRDLIADMETPLSAYWKLAHDETYSFLLESVTGGETIARYSILGVRPRLVLRTKGQSVRHIRPDGESHSTLCPGQDPLHALEEAMQPGPVVGAEGMPRFCGGAVGMLSYDLVRFFEKLPDTTQDDLQVDDLAMMLCDSIVVFDRAKNLVRVIVMADGTPEAYDEAVAEIERVVARLRGSLPPLPTFTGEKHPVESNLTPEEFKHIVSQMVDYITAGDGIQMVPAQRFSTRVEAHPLTLYRSLRSLNPSPYLFLMRFGDFDIVGASPELLVGLDADTARVRPIAGTRWRGADDEEDKALERELLADEKERAEHIMLVDLGRNDLGRVCEFGSVKVDELMVVERYSHVMHIVSNVTGKLKADQDAFSLIRACFPAGTVSGAPKVRAMEIIDELEPTRRGLYAGSVGYIGYGGDMDTAIAIRTIYLKDGVAYVQAGGGVVYDSTPEFEFNESCNKAKAALRAIELAQQGLEDAL